MKELRKKLWRPIKLSVIMYGIVFIGLALEECGIYGILVLLGIIALPRWGKLIAINLIVFVYDSIYDMFHRE